MTIISHSGISKHACSAIGLINDQVYNLHQIIQLKLKNGRCINEISLKKVMEHNIDYTWY